MPCQPMVVAMISGVGASRLIGEPVAEMPFANMCSRVAAGLEEFSNRGFPTRKCIFCEVATQL